MTGAPRRRGTAIVRARDRLYIAGLAFLISASVLHLEQVVTPGLYARDGYIKGADYVQFYVMGWLARSAPGAPLYDTRAHVEVARRRIDPAIEAHAPHPNYGPQVALAFSPLSRLSYGASLALFSVLSACAYLTAIWLLRAKAGGLATEKRLVMLWALASPAFHATLRFGQLSTFTLLFLALAVVALASGRRGLAGLCLGAMWFKPQLLVVAVPALALARDWRCLAGVGFAGALQLLIGWAAGGSDGVMAYGEALITLAAAPDRVILFPEIAHSFRGFLRLSGMPSIVATASAMVLLAAMIPFAARIWRRANDPLLQVGTLVVATALATPHLLTYDLLLLTVPLVAIVNWLVRHPDTPRRPALVLLLAAVYLSPFSPILAVRTRVQVSTLAMGLLAAAMWSIATAQRPHVGSPVPQP